MKQGKLFPLSSYSWMRNLYWAQTSPRVAKCHLCPCACTCSAARAPLWPPCASRLYPFYRTQNDFANIIWRFCNYFILAFIGLLILGQESNLILLWPLCRTLNVLRASTSLDIVSKKSTDTSLWSMKIESNSCLIRELQVVYNNFFLTFVGYYWSSSKSRWGELSRAIAF